MQFDFATLFSPILFVLLLVTAVNRAFTLWQKERTPKVFYFFVVFACFCLLYLASWWQWPLWARDVVRVALIWSLAWANWYDWREFFAFVRAAEAAAMKPAPVSTLQDLGDSQREPGPTVALEATEKPTDDEPPWETKPTIDERDFG